MKGRMGRIDDDGTFFKCGEIKGVTPGIGWELSGGGGVVPTPFDLIAHGS